MSGSYPFNQFTTPPIAEAPGDWPPLPPRYSDGVLPSFYPPTMSEIVPRWRMPSDFEIPPWNNLNAGLHNQELGCMYPPTSNDSHRLLPSCRGVEIYEGPLSRRSNVDFRSGNSNEMRVCRQFQHRGKCAYGDQCRFLHEIPEKSRDFGSSSQNYVVRTTAFGHETHDTGRRGGGFDQLEEVRSQVQTKIVARSEIPRPVSYKTRPCYPWQTTGHCPYGELCRFAHGEAELQKFESNSASELGSVGCASATTSAAAEAGLRSSRGIGTDCNTVPRMKQFFKSKELKNLIGIYGDWLED